MERSRPRGAGPRARDGIAAAAVTGMRMAASALLRALTLVLLVQLAATKYHVDAANGA